MKWQRCQTHFVSWVGSGLQGSLRTGFSLGNATAASVAPILGMWQWLQQQLWHRAGDAAPTSASWIQPMDRMFDTLDLQYNTRPAKKQITMIKNTTFSTSLQQGKQVGIRNKWLWRAKQPRQSLESQMHCAVFTVLFRLSYDKSPISSLTSFPSELHFASKAIRALQTLIYFLRSWQKDIIFIFI